MTLTPEQQTAYDSILECVAKKQDCRLIGYAGTGKTHLTRTLAASSGGKIYFSATTNKATAVLADNLPQSTCTTVHKFLGMKRTKEGKFVVCEPAWGQCETLVVDEASMLNKEIYAALQKTKPANRSIVFVGDDAQVPPVKEQFSVALDAKTKMPTFRLEAIVRQKEGNPIIEYSKDIREKGVNAKVPKCDNIIQLPANAITAERLLKLIMKDGEQIGVYGAFTNRKVDMVNASVHRHLYGETEHPYVPGEEVVFCAAFYPPWAGGSPMAQNGDICRVVGFVKEESVNLTHEKEYLVEGYTFEFENMDEHFLATVPKFPVKYKKMLDALYKAQNYRTATAYSDYFANVKLSYACTIHKLQGSTYRNAVIDKADILSGAERDPSQAKKLFYVGVTRPTTTLVIVG